MLQNVNSRMKQNRTDYYMKICGKIDKSIKNNRFLGYFWQGYYTTRCAWSGRRTTLWRHWMTALSTFHLGPSFHIQFRAQRCQKYASHEKKLPIKVVQNWIFYKKVSKWICLSLSRVELRESKDWYGWNIILYRKGEIHSI